MILAYEEEDRFSQVWLWSKGVIFMGTPHQGSKFANMGKTLGEIANVALYMTGSNSITGGVKTSLLRDISLNSSTLRGITRSFRQRSSALRISTFYETEITPPTGTIVGLGFYCRRSIP